MLAPEDDRAVAGPLLPLAKTREAGRMIVRDARRRLVDEMEAAP